MWRPTSWARSPCRCSPCSDPEALEYRLENSGAAALITDAGGLAKLAEIRAHLPVLKTVISIDGPGDGALGFHELMEKASDSFTPRDTAAEDPALIIYTSGTTGPPKGALHAQRVLLGHLPGVELPQEFFPQGRRFVLDAGRLGLDRRPARRSAAGLAPRRAGA